MKSLPTSVRDKVLACPGLVEGIHLSMLVLACFSFWAIATELRAEEGHTMQPIPIANLTDSKAALFVFSASPTVRYVSRSLLADGNGAER